MLTIRNEQIEELSRERTKAFLAHAKRFIATTLRVEVDPVDIDALFQRGKNYRLESEKDLVRYMFIAVAAGAGATRQDPDWVEETLRRPAPSDEIRTRRLFLEASQRLPDDIAKRLKP